MSAPTRAGVTQNDGFWMDRLDDGGRQMLHHCLKSLSLDRKSRTALMIVAMNGFEQSAIALANPESCAERDAEGMSALMLAAKHGQARCVEILLAHSDPRLLDAKGMSPLMHAASVDLGWNSLDPRENPLESISLLMPVSDIDAIDLDGWSALMHAAARGQDDVAKMLAAESDLGYAVRADHPNWAGWDAAGLARDQRASTLGGWLSEFALARSQSHVLREQTALARSMGAGKSDPAKRL